jgi:hypothetical protein
MGDADKLASWLLIIVSDVVNANLLLVVITAAGQWMQVGKQARK